MARIIGHTDADLQIASESLRGGGLVAVPTETVYGLGADALNAEAAARIFTVKGRPPTDPLIVHVLGWEDAEKLVGLSEAQRVSAVALAAAFWPGPLTMVLPVSSIVPPLITSNTGWVGVRSPKHPTARRLLEVSGVCIAAPSANRFNHVSPTLPEHVMADLAERDPTLLVVDGGASEIGIESTVVKVHEDSLQILRRGAVSPAQLLEALQATGNAQLQQMEVSQADTLRKPKVVTDNMEAPGQMLTHYAPNIPAYLAGGGCSSSVTTISCEDASFPIGSVAVIDFNGELHGLAESCIAYRDLSVTGSSDEAAAALFEVLRWSEGIKDAQAVLVPNLPAISRDTLDLAEAVQDRLFRACSGRTAVLQ